jgi:hypothetical protein
MMARAKNCGASYGSSGSLGSIDHCHSLSMDEMHAATVRSTRSRSARLPCSGIKSPAHHQKDLLV